MLKHRFFRAGSKDVITYNEKYYGTKASFCSYIEGLENFQIEHADDEIEEVTKEKEYCVPTKASLHPPVEFVPHPVKGDPPPPLYTEVVTKNGGINENEANRKGVSNTPIPSKITGRVAEALEELRNGNKLEKFLESNGLRVSSISLPKLKQALDNFLQEKDTIKEKEITKWEKQIDNLRELSDERKLRKWLESVGVPASKVSIPLVQHELKKYFENEEKAITKSITPKVKEPKWGKKSEEKVKQVKKEKDDDDDSTPCTIDATTKTAPPVPRDFGPCMKLEDFKGRSLLLREETVANKIWEEFKGMSGPKQVAVIVGVTVVTAALGFLSWRLLLFAFPAAFNANRYWGEVLAQWFVQRQESTFNLLCQHAQNAKPLSTAWANQYILWKYI